MLSLRIAFRYLVSRKSHGTVNTISAISVAAVAVAAAAMIIVLSVFNGFSSLAAGKLSRLDPDYMLVPVKGKTIAAADSLCALLRSIPGVASAEPEITEQAFATTPQGRRMGLIVKGMTPAGLAASGLGGVIIDGDGSLAVTDSLLPPSIISVGTAVSLNLRPSVDLCDFTLYEPRRLARVNPANPMGAFRSIPLQATGVYQIEQEEYDKDMVIIPYAVASRLLDYPSSVASSVAVQLRSGASASSVASALEKVAAERSLRVLDRFRQQQAAFRMIAVEKWITFLMLGFILLIASFNIVSTLYMMMLEKLANMRILHARGATRAFVARIFVSQGWLIVVLGGVAGIILGSLLVLGQQHFGWIKLSAADPSLMAVDSYPVVLSAGDILTTLLAVLAVAILITPAILLLDRRRPAPPLV